MSHFTVGVILNDIRNLDNVLDKYNENSNFSFVPSDENDIRYFEKTYEKNIDKYESFEDFIENVLDLEIENNIIGSYRNPIATWDWFEIGGRWKNSLITKNGKVCDYAKLKDIDWESMENKIIEELRQLYRKTEKGSFEAALADIKKEDTEQSYIDRESKFSTFSVITPDGEWHEKEYFKELPHSYHETFIENENQELYFVIVDCHI